MPRKGYASLTVRQEDYKQVKDFFDQNKKALRAMGLGSVSDLVTTATLEKIKELRDKFEPSVMVTFKVNSAESEFDWNDEKVDERIAETDPTTKPILLVVQDGRVLCSYDNKENCVHIQSVMSSRYSKEMLGKFVRLQKNISYRKDSDRSPKNAERPER